MKNYLGDFINGQKGLVSKMSVSLQEVLENAGYDIKNNVDDARWLLSQESELYDLLDKAGRLEDDWTEYSEFVDTQEELGNFINPTFEEWREERENDNE